jgi:hypothetical protein
MLGFMVAPVAAGPLGLQRARLEQQSRKQPVGAARQAAADTAWTTYPVYITVLKSGDAYDVL